MLQPWVLEPGPLVFLMLFQGGRAGVPGEHSVFPWTLALSVAKSWVDVSAG